VPKKEVAIAQDDVRGCLDHVRKLLNLTFAENDLVYVLTEIESMTGQLVKDSLLTHLPPLRQIAAPVHDGRFCAENPH
jgi:hypothetical protein